MVECSRVTLASEIQSRANNEREQRDYREVKEGVIVKMLLNKGLEAAKLYQKP